MDRWRTILRRFGPRSDAERDFYPDRLDAEQPVLINTMGPVAAAFVGARVLRAIAARGGTLVRLSMLEKLEQLASRGLSQEAIHHCEAEAERVLEWLDRAPPSGETDVEGTSKTPELDVMMAADLESRLSVATFALDEGYDLELEYFDEDDERWPRIRAGLEAIEEAEAADFHTALRLRTAHGPLTVHLKHVRWLMPVPPRDWDDDAGDEGGDVLEFPDFRDET